MTDKIPAHDTAVFSSDRAPLPTKSKPVKRASGALISLALVLLLLVAGLSWALWKQRIQFNAAGREVAVRLDALDADIKQSRNDMREALALSQAQAGYVRKLEESMRETQTQYETWLALADSSNDELLANDIERLLLIASQQLRLAGNVGNAIVALETAQTRLVRSDRPRFSSVQQSINGDLDRLRAVPSVDIPAQSARMEHLSALINTAPLWVPDASSAVQPAQQAEPQRSEPVSAPEVVKLDEGAPWWQRWKAGITSWPGRVGTALAHELGNLISIQRVDDPAALLMAPEQVEQVRSVLRQRVMAAQLAMLMRQPTIWKTELDHVVNALTHYFDAQSPDTVAALNLARELSQVDIAVRVPDVADSLNSVAALRAAGFSSSNE